MNRIKVIARAESYLRKNKIPYVKPGIIAKEAEHQIEVIFLVPEALDPNVVIDPPDVRVLVDVYSGEITLIPQM